MRTKNHAIRYLQKSPAIMNTRTCIMFNYLRSRTLKRHQIAPSMVPYFARHSGDFSQLGEAVVTVRPAVVNSPSDVGRTAVAVNENSILDRKKGEIRSRQQILLYYSQVQISYLQLFLILHLHLLGGL